MKLLFGTLLGLLVAATDAQTFLDAPEAIFQSVVGPTQVGNECDLTAAGDVLICTDSTGTVTAINPDDPDMPVIWSNEQEPTLEATSSSGFSSIIDASIGDFLVHGVTMKARTW